MICDEDPSKIIPKNDSFFMVMSITEEDSSSSPKSNVTKPERRSPNSFGMVAGTLRPAGSTGTAGRMGVTGTIGMTGRAVVTGAAVTTCLVGVSGVMIAGVILDN